MTTIYSDWHITILVIFSYLSLRQTKNELGYGFFIIKREHIITAFC